MLYVDTASGEVCQKRKAFVIEIRCITNLHLDFSLVLAYVFFLNDCIKPFLCFAWSVHFATDCHYGLSPQ